MTEESGACASGMVLSMEGNLALSLALDDGPISNPKRRCGGSELALKLSLVRTG